MLGSFSQAEFLASQNGSVRAEVLGSLTEAQAESLLWDWQFWARPNQLAPDGEWSTWAAIAGRGFGKTKLGCEWVRENVCGKTPLAAGKYCRVALVAETAADARDVIVEGESGLLAIHPPEFRPKYEVSKRRLTWPNGARATTYNATEPDQLRGPQHDAALCDELAKWMYAQETWDMLQFGLRIGPDPRAVVTTTPRPIQTLKDILADPTTKITYGSTYENYGNLSPKFIKRVVTRYEGTRLGRQELRGELLEDVPGALWTRLMIDQAKTARKLPDLQRVVVGVDPSGSSGEPDDDANDIGIVAVGLGVDGHGYVLEDATCALSPAGWGRRSVQTYQRNRADRIVGEKNFGGAMVQFVIRTTDKEVSYKDVTASRGKVARAEPVSALYEQKRIHHVPQHGTSLVNLEEQMLQVTSAGFVGNGSPDRVDALVWAVTELMLDSSGYTLANI